VIGVLVADEAGQPRGAGVLQPGHLSKYGERPRHSLLAHAAVADADLGGLGIDGEADGAALAAAQRLGSSRRVRQGRSAQAMRSTECVPQRIYGESPPRGVIPESKKKP
jgi:hypothetical protein